MNFSCTGNHRPDIDGLRALAVTLVVMFHADMAFPGGYVGVDVFFVISGYLITRLILTDIEQGRFSFSRFWIRRIRRILPILLVVVLVTLALGLVHLWPDDLVGLSRSAFSVLSLVSNIYFWKDAGYFTAGVENQPLLHTWSLAVEEQFYLVYPLLLVLLAKRVVNRKLFFTLLFFLTIAAMVFSLLIWHRSASAAFYLLPPRGWELLVGAVLASRRCKPTLPPALNNALAATGLALVVGSAMLYDRSTPFPGYNAIVPVAGAAALIYAGSAGRSVVGFLLTLTPLVYLGLVSYSLYLWHWPLLIFARIRFPDAEHLGWWVIAISTVLSVLSWKLIEQPFRQARFGIVKLFVSLGILVFLILALCFVSLSTSGLPNRHSAFETLNRNAEFEVSDTALISLSGVQLGRAPSTTDGNAVDFIIVGDSHAGFLLPMLSRLATEVGVSGLSLVRAGRKPFGNRQQQQPIHEAIVQMIKNHKPRAVFLSARWSKLFASEASEAMYAENIDLVNGIIRAGQSVNSQVWLVSQVPEYPMTRATLRYQIISSGSSVKQLSYPQIDTADLKRAAVDVSTAFKTLVREGATVLDVQEEFIDDDGEFHIKPFESIIYWDNNHLTQAGADELLSPVFRSVLLQLKEKR